MIPIIIIIHWFQFRINPACTRDFVTSTIKIEIDRYDTMLNIILYLIYQIELVSVFLNDSLGIVTDVGCLIILADG